MRHASDALAKKNKREYPGRTNRECAKRTEPGDAHAMMWEKRRRTRPAPHGPRGHPAAGTVGRGRPAKKATRHSIQLGRASLRRCTQTPTSLQPRWAWLGAGTPRTSIVPAPKACREMLGLRDRAGSLRRCEAMMIIATCSLETLSFRSSSDTTRA